jgi:enoyl-CoA hydratase/carnithine racemase
MSPEQEVLVSREGHVAVVTLNAPRRLNALRPDMMAFLGSLYQELDKDPSVRVIVVTGTGRAFCTGADVGGVAERAAKAASGDEAETAPPTAAQRQANTGYTTRRVKVYKPTIVAVNGMCNAAGLMFVCDADIAIAAESATFFDTHTTVGQVSALEPIIFVKGGVPLNAILRMVSLGKHERIDARTALRLGMISEVVPDEELMKRAMELAQLVAEASPAALQASLRVIWEALDQPLTDAFNAGHAAIGAHRTHPDALEGAMSFVEKRPPRWTDSTT